MIKELVVKNFSVLKDIYIEFHDKFNIITGETGAGKTVLINAIALLLGERADIQKNKKNKTEITGVFEVNDNIIEELSDIDIAVENPLIIRRIIKKDKSNAYINDIPVSISILKKIGNYLIDIHGQHSHQLLLDKKYQLKIIDILAQNEKLIYEFYQYKQEYEKLIEKKTKLSNDIQEFNKEKDYLKYVYNELQSLDIENINETELNEKLYEMENAENIKTVLQDIYNQLIDNEDLSVHSLINKSLYKLNMISSNSNKIGNISKLLNDISILIEESGNEIVNVQNNIYYDEVELNEIRKIITKIEDIKKKYSMDLNRLNIYKNEIKEKLEFMEAPENQLEEISIEIEKIKKQLFDIGDLLYKRRKSAIEKFKKNVNKILGDLNMKDTIIDVIIKHDSDNMRNDGFDDLEFIIKNKFNPNGEKLKKIASGGELSRIMLALKSTIKTNDFVHTMIFDEIDTGISGKTAEMVSKLMSKISKTKQLIVITHLPQIASTGDKHFIVEKDDKINIRSIKNNERIEEIARLLGSSISKETALKHAKALLKKK